jgi:hypothetical protein
MGYLVLGLIVLFALLGLVVQLRILPHPLNIGGLRAYYKEKARKAHEDNVQELMQFANEEKRRGPQR